MRLLPVLALALVSALGCAVPAAAALVAVPVPYTLEDTTFSGRLVYDDADATPRPGLVMVPNWMGVTPAAIERAEQVAAGGYVVLVADVYGQDVRPADSAEAGAQVQKMYADLPALRARVARAAEVLREQAGRVPLRSGRIGAFGFCFGGRAVLEWARTGADLAGVVSLHGGLDTTDRARPGSVKAPLLVLNGAADPYVDADAIAAFGREMDAAGADWQFVNFSRAAHCFAEPGAAMPPACVYDARAATRAYRMLADFFAERFAAR